MYKVPIACELVVDVLTTGSKINAHIVDSGLPQDKQLYLVDASVEGQSPHQILWLTFAEEPKEQQTIDVVLTRINNEY